MPRNAGSHSIRSKRRGGGHRRLERAFRQRPTAPSLARYQDAESRPVALLKSDHARRGPRVIRAERQRLRRRSPQVRLQRRLDRYRTVRFPSALITPDESSATTNIDDRLLKHLDEHGLDVVGVGLVLSPAIHVEAIPPRVGKRNTCLALRIRQFSIIGSNHPERQHSPSGL